MPGNADDDHQEDLNALLDDLTPTIYLRSVKRLHHTRVD
jgi:hypothetical protein